MFNYQTLFEVVKILVKPGQKSSNIQGNRLSQQKSKVVSLEDLNFLFLAPANAGKKNVLVEIQQLVVGTVAEGPEKIVDYELSIRELLDLIHLHAVVPLQEEVAFFYAGIFQKGVIYITLVGNNQGLRSFPSIF
jgi:hypothetical protein